MDDLQPILAVILVLSLLTGLLYFLRRRGIASFPSLPAGSGFGRQTANARQMKVLERVPLGTQHALHLVRVGDRLILVATAPGSCQLLDGAIREGTGL
jgi:flagellar biogenesis protein FliO